MPNLHLTKEQIQALTTFLLGSQETSLPAQLSVQARRRAADIQEGWWIVKKYNCMGCHQFIPGQQTILMGMQQYQDEQEQLPPKLLTEGARVDPEWLRRFLSNPSLSTTDTNRNGVRPYLESAHADVLLLGQRTAQAGALLPGALAAADALHSGAGADADRQRNRHGAQPVLQHGGALPEVPRHRRSAA